MALSKILSIKTVVSFSAERAIPISIKRFAELESVVIVSPSIDLYLEPIMDNLLQNAKGIASDTEMTFLVSSAFKRRPLWL